MAIDPDHMGDGPNKQLIVIIQPDGLFELDWQAVSQVLDSNSLAIQDEIYKCYQQHYEQFWFQLGMMKSSQEMSESLSFLIRIAATYVRRLAQNPDIEVLREKAVVELKEDEIDNLLYNVPYLIGSQYLDRSWIEKAWVSLHQSFGYRMENQEGSIAQLLMQSDSTIHLSGRVYFHLVENKQEGEYPFSFLSTYAAELSAEGKSRHLPLKSALLEYGENSSKLLDLLGAVNKVSEKSEFISELIESGDIFFPIGLSADEAYTFLREVLLYEEAGILCRIPKWWKNKSDALKLTVSVGDKQPSYLSAEALLGFDAELWLGGEVVTTDELRQLLAEEEGLTFIKGKWVEVNHKRLEEALQAYEQAQQKMDATTGLSLVEAMRLQINANKVFDISEEKVELEVTNGQWLDSVMNRLTHPEEIESLATAGDDFHANLRPYQERGLGWLYSMKSLGLGACLADDMGLGKTVQVIALLNMMRTEKQEKSLLVVPASLIGNWMAEIAKFAPSLKYIVYHPSENKGISEHDGSLEKNELFITTYGMLAKYEWLTERTWDTLILDEAQAIKNPGTKQTKLVKQIKATYKIAMTGTPIENRLSDLWSLFDFLNKGLLGTAKEFTQFTKSMRESVNGYTRLKQVINPFILRRLKTDKSIITDLPDKIEMKTYSTLTKKQVILYNKLVQELQRKIESSEEGIERKGLVLAALMKFKQICNHPDQYLGQQVYAEGESGKYARLREICETIYEKRERVIVFTQFKEMTESLRAFLEGIFQHEGLVLHGETPVSKRKDLVDQFQGKEYVPFMVLSIKAAGVGLNLTSANHVIHFDRWWNPAVENQATDRAFRIGQQKNVIVHKFITQGTIEEKIDQMIENKMKLTSEIVPDIQESWITEMNNEQIMDLMRLSI